MRPILSPPAPVRHSRRVELALGGHALTVRRAGADLYVVTCSCPGGDAWLQAGSARQVVHLWRAHALGLVAP